MSAHRYRVDLAPAAQRQLRRLPPGEAAALRAPILALGMNPRPPGAMELAGADAGRIRVGQLRIIYLVEDESRVVVILKVARRSESTSRRVG